MREFCTSIVCVFDVANRYEQRASLMLPLVVQALIEWALVNANPSKHEAVGAHRRTRLITLIQDEKRIHKHRKYGFHYAVSILNLITQKHLLTEQ